MLVQPEQKQLRVCTYQGERSVSLADASCSSLNEQDNTRKLGLKGLQAGVVASRCYSQKVIAKQLKPAVLKKVLLAETQNPLTRSFLT